MAEIRGVINESWSRRLSQQYDIIDEHNHRESRHLSKKITFTNLGGLVVRFIEPDDVVTPKELETLAIQRNVIDLAINPVRDYLITFTSEILKAVVEARGPENRLAQQLQNRMYPPLPADTDPLDVLAITRHRRDEIWLIPLIEVLPLERYDKRD